MNHRGLTQLLMQWDKWTPRAEGQRARNAAPARLADPSDPEELMARGDVVANTWRRARVPRARRFPRRVEQARRPTATRPALSVTSCAAAIRRPPRPPGRQTSSRRF